MPRLPAVTCLQRGLLTCRLKDSLTLWLGQPQADDKVSGGCSNEPKAQESRLPPEAWSRAQTCLASAGSPAPAPPVGTGDRGPGALPLEGSPQAAAPAPPLRGLRSTGVGSSHGIRPPLALCKISSWERLLVCEAVEVKPSALLRSGKVACRSADLPLSLCR